MLCICDGCYFSLCWFGYHVICITVINSHYALVLQNERKTFAKCVMGIWCLYKIKHTFRGAPLKFVRYTHLYLKMNCVVINHQKRREIQSASWPLIVLVIMTEAPNWRPERGEWMGDDKNSSRRIWLLQQVEHNLSNTYVSRTTNRDVVIDDVHLTSLRTP
jgi:hypothetical protein